MFAPAYMGRKGWAQPYDRFLLNRSANQCRIRESFERMVASHSEEPALSLSNGDG
jgi:hypothetical protein